MKRILYILTCFVLSMMTLQGYAQSLDDQLLIFRNTGETNLLYQSEIDSITFTKVDTLGVEYDSPIAQVFHTADTTLYVSIAEIDSVCFGSRNEIEFYDDVKVLAENPDMQWIIRYDGSSIYYKTNTPSDILPTVGQKLYFTEQTELFPYGLCAKVDNVSRGSAEIKVAVSSIEAKEVFSKFFYSGSFDGVAKELNHAARKVEEIDKGETIKFFLAMDGVGSLNVDGRIGVKGDVVLDVFKDYYHADITIENIIGMSATLEVAAVDNISTQKDFIHIPLPTVAAVFQPSIDVGGFIDINAEMDFDFALNRKVTTRIDWTRKGKVQKFTRSNPTESGDQSNQANIQFTINGSLYFGLVTTFNFALIGDVVGAKAKMKLGPEFSGEISVGALSELSKNFDAALYAKGEVGVCTKLGFEGYFIHRKNWVWGDVEETQFCEYSHAFGNRTLDIFPKFFASRAVASPKKDNISVAVKTGNEIATNVQTGFQLVKKDDVPQPVETVLVEEIDVKPDNVIQGITTDIEIPDNVNNLENYAVRPVIKYAGYTIPHAITNIAQNPNIQPIIFNVANKKAKVVSGVPIVDNVKIDNTLYNIGPFVNVATHDEDFFEESPYVDPYYNEDGSGTEYIYIVENISLYGDWSGELDGENISITFNEDGSGKYSCDDLTMDEAHYTLNEPQSGCIEIKSDDDSVVIELLSMTASSLELRFKNSVHKKKECTLHRN